VVTANGIVATGFGLGFMLSAMLSDTVLSPLLGGWRNVVFLYGAISIAIGIIWLLTRSEPSNNNSSAKNSTVPFRQALSHVFKIRELWLLALTQLCFTGCVVAIIGYLPLYLRNLGWATGHADGALASLNAAGMIAAIPLSMLSGKLNSRKGVLLPIMLITLICTFLLTFSKGILIWPLVILVGFVRDAYYSIIATMAMETEGIGGAYAGTAIGLMWTFGSIGSFIAPPLGNSLASISPALPFAFWGSIMILPLILLFFLKETGRKQK
jgi:NNP family nitrate/nitrite transporter-like MFS transporter